MSRRIFAFPGAAGLGAGMLGIVLIAVNLRVGFVTVGPLLEGIRADVGMSAGEAGLLAGLPLLAFAVFSPVAPVLSRVLGLHRASWFSLLLLSLGLVLRSVELAGMVWAGTVLLGAGIAFLNVLMPSLVKRQFPLRVGYVTGVYTSVQGAFAALGAAVVVPVAAASPLGWRLALGCWATLALVALAALVPWARRKAPVFSARAPSSATRSPWTSLLGWQVTLFMGLQSLSYFVFTAWLPGIERSHGVSADEAGIHMALFLLVGVCASLATGAIMTRLPDQRTIGLAGSLLALAAFLGLAFAPGLMLVWICCGAVACGSLIVLALSLFSLRTSNHTQAAGLSGMAQSVGYALAGAGPLAFGVLFEVTGEFRVPLLLAAGCMVLLCLLAVQVGRVRTIE